MKLFNKNVLKKYSTQSNHDNILYLWHCSQKIFFYITLTFVTWRFLSPCQDPIFFFVISLELTSVFCHLSTRDINASTYSFKIRCSVECAIQGYGAKTVLGNWNKTRLVSLWGLYTGCSSIVWVEQVVLACIQGVRVLILWQLWRRNVW